MLNNYHYGEDYADWWDLYANYEAAAPGDRGRCISTWACRPGQREHHCFVIHYSTGFCTYAFFLN